jgi:hypothetical protein
MEVRRVLSSLIMMLGKKYRGQDSNLHKLAHLILSQEVGGAGNPMGLVKNL